MRSRASVQQIGLASRAEEIADAETALATFRDKDLALEWCEERLLLRVAPDLENGYVPFADNELCHGLNPGAIQTLEAAARRLQFAAGETILRAGEDGESVYLLTRGEVSVTIELPGGGSTRVATLAPGMTFGEMAMLGESVRSANVQTDSEVECWELSMTDLSVWGNWTRSCGPSCTRTSRESSLLTSAARMQKCVLSPAR